MNTMIKQEYPVYKKYLAIEMKHQGLECSREHEMEISYKSEHIGTRRVDFFVAGKINAELKAYGLDIGLPFKRVLKRHKNHSQSTNK
jgi:hypothetical protein